MSGLPPGHVSRGRALAAYELHRAQSAGVVTCQACGCPWLAHYGLLLAGGRGCVACEDRGSGCPAYVQGSLPYNLAKHADALDAPGPCPWLCGHAADGHSGSYGCLRCACGYGDPAAAQPRGITYRRYPASDRDGRPVVVMEAPAGTPVTRLGGTAEDSPSGIAWGYGGPGSLGLARSLLIAALGPAAACPSCAGRGRIAWAEDLAALVPYDAEHDEPPGEVFNCGCEDGFRPDLPSRDFEFAMPGLWEQEGGWAVSRADILRWLAVSSPRMHAAAVAALPEDA